MDDGTRFPQLDEVTLSPLLLFFKGRAEEKGFVPSGSLVLTASSAGSALRLLSRQGEDVRNPRWTSNGTCGEVPA